LDVLILAAGRGARMRPLTDRTPKPLLRVGGESLIARLVGQLAAAGLRRLVVNHAHLGEQIVQALGDGGRWGVRIRYSDESGGALETGGGICQALPWLESDPFLVVNGDLYTDYPFGDSALAAGDLARLVLVDNPPHHPGGDFHLAGDRLVPPPSDAPRLTFAGIGLYRHELFQDCPRGRAFPLAPLLRRAVAAGRAGGEHYRGLWEDVGTPARLAELNRRLAGA